MKFFDNGFSVCHFERSREISSTVLGDFSAMLEMTRKGYYWLVLLVVGLLSTILLPSFAGTPLTLLEPEKTVQVTSSSASTALLTNGKLGI